MQICWRQRRSHFSFVSFLILYSLKKAFKGKKDIHVWSKMSNINMWLVQRIIICLFMIITRPRPGYSLNISSKFSIILQTPDQTSASVLSPTQPLHVSSFIPFDWSISIFLEIYSCEIYPTGSRRTMEYW